MLLAVDIGNSSIKFGVYKNEKIVYFFTVYSDKGKTSDEYKVMISSIFASYSLHSSDIDACIISSVVPTLTHIIVSCVNELCKIQPMVVDCSLKTKVRIKLDNPAELGADLLCDCVGALDKFQFPILIADLGTVSKILLIDNKGDFCGGTIMPGIGISYKSLADNASLLSMIPVKLSEKIETRNTKDSINSGVLYGQIEAIKGICNTLEKQYGYSFKKILTGGYAEIIKEKLGDFTYVKTLTLDGLNKIYKINKPLR